MNVLITHECSGVVRDAFRALGHNAYSCDLKPSPTNTPFHIQDDAIVTICKNHCPSFGKWDLIGMHPECRFLTVSGLHWNNRGRGWENTDKALQHVKDCMAAATEAGCPWYLENSISIISSKIRKPDQIIQPYQFGHDASKATCLWLHGLPPLVLDPYNEVAPRMVNGRPRWENQTDSGQNRLGPSETRSADRAKTYPGIAKAMAAQWSEYILAQ